MLGFSLCRTALLRGVQVVALYNAHRIELPGAEIVKADLTNEERVSQVFSKYEPEWVIHCAAATDVDWCESHPEEAWRVNVQATRNVTLANKEISGRLVYVSTDSVFDGSKGNYSENDVPAPINVYARTKLAGEQMITRIVDNCLIVRTSFFGFRLRDDSGFIAWALAKLENHERVPGFFDVFFNPLFVDDLSEIILEAANQNLTGVYHVAGSEISSKYDFLLKLAKAFSLNPDLVQRALISKATLRAPRPRNTTLNTAKISSALDTDMPSLTAGLSRLKRFVSSDRVNVRAEH